ncbi:MAG: tyrosine-type recombinase/integrase [Desulfobulbaceae bacterium]|nr:tyrosine-type recombinase/integrase [Desulfobulbaceae bacterium]
MIDAGLGKKYSFYEFNMFYTSQQVPELRRWFIDPFTELLLLRLPSSAFVIEDNEKKAGTKAWRSMVRFLLHVGIESSSMPRSLPQFLEIAKAWNWFRLPGFLCNYASSDIVSHSLKPHVWRRFFGLMNRSYENEAQQPRIEALASPTEQEIEDAEIGADEPDEEEQFVEFSWIKDLRALLKGFNRKEIDKKLREVAACLDGSFSMQVIGTKWVCFMMTYRSSSGKAYSLAAIRRLAGHILSRVAGLVDDTDITLLEGDGLVEIYQQLLTDVQSDTYRYKIACGLREFHHFLVEKYHISPINFREVLGIGSKASRVDANILSIDEYHQSQECLKGMTAQLDPHTNLIDVAQIIFILAFRCGLRRNEALKLMANDLHEHHPVILLIRENDVRRLKTQSSTRSLNLSLLLTPKELEKLLVFKQVRDQEILNDPKDPGYLFCIPKMSYSFVPEERVYDAIRDAMHLATGDRTLRFHHLRHSMASWRVLSLMLADIDIFDDLFPDHPLTTEFLRSAKEFKTGLYSRNEPTRKHLLTLASMLGHSGPDISCTSYIHLFDLALKIALESSADQCDRLLLVMASGVARSTAQRIFKQGGIAALLDGARKRAPADRLICNMVVDSPRPLPDERDEILPPEVRMMERVWEYLILKSSREVLDPGFLVGRTGISEHDARHIEIKAITLKDDKPKSKIGYRHRMKVIVKDKRYPVPVRLMCPPKPRLRRDREIVNEFSPRLWQLLQEPDSLMNDMIDLFIRNSWYTRNEIIFHGLKESSLAKKYIEFLQHLGIHKGQIAFVCFDDTKGHKHRKRWQEELGLNWRNKPELAKPTNLNSPRSRFWLGIKPVFPTGKGLTGAGSYGFRYLMVMSAISYSCFYSMNKSLLSGQYD